MPIERGEGDNLGGDPAAELSSRVHAAQNGDRAALERLLRDHYDKVYGVCHRLVGNDADAADAAQEAMISIVRGLKRFDGRSSFSTWAYRIAYNASVDLLRARARRPVSSIDDPDAEPVDLAASEAVGSLDERLDISRALQRLPVDFRGPIVLRDLCGLDYAEIGEVLRIPPGTVRSRIARGRAALADSIRPARSET